jgi:ribonuclease J
MQVTIHRGTHEIGGNCVELASGSTRIVVDVGLPLVGPCRDPFDAKAIKGRTSVQLLAEGVLPNVPGLFAGGPSPDAILLSHAHADHTGFVDRTQPTIPVYLSRGTSKMLLAGEIFAGQSGIRRERERVFEPGRPFEVGDIRITAYPVDHSAYDSMALVIEAEGKRLLYSGDLRLHGRKPGMAKQLIAAAAVAPIDLMMMEGTHFSPGRERGFTEQELEEKIVQHIQSAPGLVLASFSPLHVDRLVSFYRATKRSGRRFIVDPYAAFVMHLVSGRARIPAPSSEAGIRVYFNRYFEVSHERRRIKKIRDLFAANQIGLDEIRPEPKKYVMVFRPSMVDRDFSGGLPENVRCLYSYWDGYLRRPEWTSLRSSIAAVGGDLVEAHTSGHIFADDIVEFVRDINPQVVVPIHTFEPDRFREIFPNVVVLSDGQALEVE